MKGWEKRCNDVFQAFKQEHPEFFRQPIIRSFLQDEKHLDLVKKALCYPTKKNMQLVDEAFHTFYGSVKLLTYLSNLIYYNAINFDKTIQKHYNREMLILDKPLREENEGITYKDMLYQPLPDMANRVACESIVDCVEDPQLYKAIQTLTPKQREILSHKYVQGLKNKEIADLYHDSPQNVSKLHQRALQKLKSNLKKERDSYVEH
ncbi:MAG: RNA polymerase sigma factor [Bacillota bacterium]